MGDGGGRRRNPRGWGFVDAAAAPGERDRLAALLRARFPGIGAEPETPGPVVLPAPRVRPPAALASIAASDDDARLLAGVGRSYLDMVTLLRGRVDAVPDVVLRPRDEAEVAAALDWCSDAGAVCIPVGGATSVVGGVTPHGVERPVVALSLEALDRVVEVDAVSRLARIQAGASGPVLEDQLRPSGLTLRFYPQSFELSTLGGWIATRAAGHDATGATHVDDLVAAVTAVTPAGRWSSRRLPGSGAGPSPDRLLLGSEGTLGVITEADVRVRPRPVWRASASAAFASFSAGAAAVRAVAQSDLRPAGLRLLDPVEAALAGAGDGSAAVLVLGLESADAPVEAAAARALELVRDHGGTPSPVTLRGPDGGGVARDEAADAWRSTFLRAPYLRDVMVSLGVLVETFETALTWDRFDDGVSAIMAAAEHAVRDACGDGLVTVRTTHAYPDGAAPYFTVLAPARPGSERAQWLEVKAAASEAILAAGATITHHHAVGRDHRPWYDRQRPDPFAAALRAAKHALDPGALLNPGVLLDP